MARTDIIDDYRKRKKEKDIFSIVGDKIRDVQSRDPDDDIFKRVGDKTRSEIGKKELESETSEKNKKAEVVPMKLQTKKKEEKAAPEAKTFKRPSVEKTKDSISEILKKRSPEKTPTLAQKDSVDSVEASPKKDSIEQVIEKKKGPISKIEKPSLDVSKLVPEKEEKEEKSIWGDLVSILPSLAGALLGGSEGLAAATPAGIEYLKTRMKEEADEKKAASDLAKEERGLKKEAAFKEFDVDSRTYTEMKKLEGQKEKDIRKAKSDKEIKEIEHKYNKDLELLKQRGVLAGKDKDYLRATDVASINQSGLNNRERAKIIADLDKDANRLDLEYSKIESRLQDRNLDREQRERLENQRAQIQRDRNKILEAKVKASGVGGKPLTPASRAANERAAVGMANQIKKDFDKTYIPLVTAIDAVKGGNYNQIRTLLSQLAKIGGDSGNIAVAEQDQQLQRTFNSDVAELKAYFGKFEDGKIPKEQQSILLDKLRKIEKIKADALRLKYSALERAFGKGTLGQTGASEVIKSYADSVIPKGAGSSVNIEDLSDDDIDSMDPEEARRLLEE